MRPLHALLVALLHAACGDSPALGPDAGGDDPSPDADTGPAAPDVTAVAVTGPGGSAPRKGDPLAIAITVDNHGGPGRVAVAPRLTSSRFADFADVPLGSIEVDLAAGAPSTVTLEVGPFLETDDDRWALGRGDYTIPAVALDGADDTEFTGGAFTIEPSNVIFDAVLYDQAYFDDIGWTDDAASYMTMSFTRPSELFVPSAPGSDDGTYVSHPGGFDEMMGVRQLFLTLPGLTATSEAGGFCEQIGAYARTALGLTRDWDVAEPAYTDPDHHGFDILVGLTPEMGGGAACGWLGVQVSSLFGFDLSLERSQIIVVHETGHLFGAPHCDPLQGYVMCGGEQHPHYQDDGLFVWHQVSFETMSNRWD